MKSEKELHLSLKDMFKEVGVPQKLIIDGAKAQVAGKAREICVQSGCPVVELEKNTSFANRSERYIKTMKNGSRSDMVKSDSPMVL